MKESTRVIARTVVGIACVTTVVVARTTVGWGSLLLMLAALAGLLVLLAMYNRRFQ